MKVTTIALATAFTLTSTFALAQADGTAGYGSVVAPSVGSYPATVGSTNVVPTWRNTGPAAPLPSVPAAGNGFGRTLTHLTGFFMTLSTTTATCQLYPMQTIAAVSSFCTKMSTVSLSTSPQIKPRNNRS